ncbi:MAG TPA: VOC family protein [Stellaceae bacterium]|nr:VOC family protein [Stellaceae bacterium]
MQNGIAGLDHVIVGVRDLERARAGWTRLGFTPTPRGRHIGQGTANYCIMFAADYVELLGLAERDAGALRLDAFLARGEGLMAAAFALADTPEAVRARLTERALHPSEPRALGRHIELPEGIATPRFSLISLPSEETPGLDCFLCGHLTPELMRRPEWLVHANGAVAVKGVNILVDGTAPLLPAYDRLFGLPQVTTTDAVVSIRVGRHRIMFSTPDDFLTMHPGLDLDPAFAPPGIAALELAVHSPAETAAYFVERGVAFAALPDGSLAVPTGEANGAILIFSRE